jgi:hypothetical protein
MSAQDDEARIYIAAQPGMATWFRRLVGGMTMLLGPIAIGIVCDSPAMQWVGFVLGITMLLAIAKQMADRTTFKSTDEARAYLDKIDAGTAP